MSANWNQSSLLGTELEIMAEFDLEPLLAALRPAVAVVRNSVDDGRHTLWLELTETDGSVDDAVRKFVDLVESLPPDVRKLWDSSSDRCLNTGVQAGVAPHALPVQLSAASIRSAARLGLRHTSTVYAYDQDKG